MPHFDIYEPIGDTHVAGWWESNAGYQYNIRVYVPAGYPDECPATYIVSPNPLMDRQQLPVTRWGTSHEAHTWQPDRNGWVKVCTFRPEYWDASNSLVQIVRKTLLWLVAYEQYCFTGTKICDLLLEMDTRY